MKKNNIFRYMFPLLSIVLVVAVGLLFHFLSSVVTGVALAALQAGGAIEGDPASHEAVRGQSSELDTSYISQKVVEMRPARTPLDTIMRNIGKEVKMDSFKTEFYSVDSREFYDTVAAAYTHQGDGYTSKAIEVDNISMWSVDDLALFDNITGAQDSDDLVCLVIAKSTTNNTITVQPLNGTSGTGANAGKLVVPSIAEDTVVVRMGKAMNELDAQAEPYAIVPTKDYNYAQIFMAQVEEGTYEAMHAKEVKWGFREYSAQNIYDLRAGIELAYLFGYRSRTAHLTDSGNVERHTCGGITRDITETLEYGTGGSDRTINESDFITWAKSIFTGNSGSDQRIMFVGDGLMSYLSKIDTVSKQQAANKTQVLWGVTFNRVETNFGTLLIKHHPLLELRNWGDEGIVLDPAFVERHVFQPMRVRELDLRSSGTRNVKANIIEEASCPVLKYPDVHKKVAPAA